MLNISNRRKWTYLFSQQAGFTLIELVIILVIVGVLSGAAMVHYQDIAGQANKGALKSSLGGIRSAISAWQMNNIVKTGSADYPSLLTLSIPGEVLLFSFPKNSYQSDANAPDSIVTGATRGTVVGTRGGWAYNPSTGEIWANTNTDIPPTCKNLAGKLNENTW